MVISIMQGSVFAPALINSTKVKVKNVSKEKKIKLAVVWIVF